MIHSPGPAKTRLEIILFSGDMVAFGPFELVRALFHRYMLFYYVFVGFCLTLVDTRSGLPRSGFNDQAVIVSFSVAAAILILALFALVLEFLSRRRGTLQIKASPILATAAVTGVVAGDVTELLAFGYGPRWDRSLVLAVFYYVLVETVAHLLMLLVMPRVLREFRDRQAVRRPEGANPQLQEPVRMNLDHVQIGGRRIAVESLFRITAEGNYLRVYSGKQRLYLPGPFGEAVDPLPEWLGVRVSRSDWVATNAVRGIRREGREMHVDLEDGTSVRVAGSRQKVVLSLLDLPVQRGHAGAMGQGAESEKSIHSG